MSPPISTHEAHILMDRAFEASSLSALDVQVPNVRVQVDPQTEDQRIHARGIVSDSNADHASEVLHRRNLTTKRFQDRLSIRGKALGNDPDTWRWRRRRRASVHLDIVLPPAMDLKIYAPGGTVNVTDLSGAVSLDVMGGAVEAEGLHGDLDVRGGGGLLAVRNGADMALDLQWTSGTVTLEDMEATSTTLRSVAAPTTVRNVRSPNEVTVQGAPLHLRDVEGRCEAQVRGGALTYRGAPSEETHLETVGGSLRAHLPSSHAADLRLSGESVWVDEAFDFEGKENARGTEGRLNGGGPPLYLRAVQDVARCLPRS